MSKQISGSPEPVPRSFRRESRLFLAVAVLLILFLNFVMLLLFRTAVDWGDRQVENRAAEILRRLALSNVDGGDTLERAALAPDAVFAGLYDHQGRKIRGFGHEIEAPQTLPLDRPPEPGRLRTEWKRVPPLLLGAIDTPRGVFALALDPGVGGPLRTYARWATILVPLAGAAFAVLAWLYLRSLLAPYERLLETAGFAPTASAGAAAHHDERDFVIARFEATIAALSEKERELALLAQAEKERADDLEIAARTLARNLPTGLLSVDPEGRVVELNEAGREILEIAGDARGEPLADVLSEVPELAAVIDLVRHRREAVTRQEIRSGQGESERVLGVTATPATGADGRFLGVLALFSDLSEVRRLEARVALARHLADLGEVSAGAAHEFRNAAAAIDGFADLAMRHPDRVAEHLKAIRREAQEMSRVTRDFLLFARPEEFVPERVSLESVVEVAVAETEMAFPEVSVEREGVFVEVPGSPVLLRRALANLLRNATEATPPARRREPGAISLSGERTDGEAALIVGDRGEGVDPVSREKIFLPFYSEKAGGAGFGLAIVARIAELHGGTVEVTSRPGGGALFTLRLSLAGPARAARQRSEPGELRRQLDGEPNPSPKALQESSGSLGKT